MPDVFISYARSTEQEAERIAEALQSRGFQVWRDDQLPAHRSYGEVIEERLRGADAVLVLWSAEAAKSQWVRAEADAARQAGTLVQASLDGAIPPLPFNQIQCADLSDWNGNLNHAGWQKAETSLQALTGAAATPQTTEQASPKRSGPSVCILPFQNMSGDPEQEYFSDGISEDITTDLSNVSALSVIARNTAFTFKGQAVDVADVARKLAVSHVLEGSVRKAGDRVRITAQLIDGKSGDHIWAERFDRDLTDIFAIQDEISKAIVAALKLKLLPEEKKAIEQRGTSSAEAYDLYLMARNCWIAGDFADRRRAERVVRICQKATEIDPEYAQPWALIGLAQAHMFYGIGVDRNIDDGSAAAERALALDPQIAEARLPRAWRLAALGQHEEVNAEIAEALRLNPDSWEVNKEAARLFYRQRRIDDTARCLERATEIMEADFHGWGMLFACYNAQGNKDGLRRCAAKIIEQVEPVLARDSNNGIALALGALSLAALGQVEQSHQWMERALLLDPDNLFMRYNLGWALAVICNDEEAAVDMFEPVLASAAPSTIRLAAVDPNLDGLRGHIRFRRMLAAAKKRTGVADESIPAIPPASSARPHS